MENLMNIKEISKPIEGHLKEFNKYFKDTMKSNVALLDIIISYMTRKRGKQVRPAMVFLSAELCGGVNQRTYIGASMIELLHTATLVHDDVVDNSDKRRGLATINAEWNNKIAVLIGDFLLAKGLLAATGNTEFGFLHATSDAVKRMSEGELLQIQKSKEIDIEEETYFRIISDKTASLLSAACKVGALSATDTKEKHDLMYQYGENVGLAFQIRDDIFDYTGDATKIGKPVGNDLKEKKITLPLLYSFRQVSKSEAKKILKMVKEDELTRDNIKKIISFVTDNGGLDYAKEKANHFSNEAINILNKFDPCPARDSLISFAKFVVDRDL
jgi:octaprenyl-diphosphate synthase